MSQKNFARFSQETDLSCNNLAFFSARIMHYLATLARIFPRILQVLSDTMTSVIQMLQSNNFANDNFNQRFLHFWFNWKHFHLLWLLCEVWGQSRKCGLKTLLWFAFDHTIWFLFKTTANSFSFAQTILEVLSVEENWFLKKFSWNTLTIHKIRWLQLLLQSWCVQIWFCFKKTEIHYLVNF